MARVRAADHPVPLAGIPDGLAAYPLEEVRTDEDGAQTVVRTRRGRAKLDRVELRALEPALHTDVIDPDLERFVLGAQRRTWPVIERHFGANAWSQAVELSRVGVVVVRCEVDGATRLGPPSDWRLTGEWNRRREEQRSQQDGRRDDWTARGASAVAAARARHPELADAVERATPGSATHAVLVHAIEDLMAEIVHAGPRAFSQAHFGATKVRDDVVAILRAAGAPESAVVALGLRRSDRIGVAGPLRAVARGATVTIDRLDGPVLLRADQPGLRLEWIEQAPLLLVENLQAAETLADRLPAIGIIYTAGLLGAAALDLVDQLAGEARGVAVIPDADPGGVRIAEQVARTVPHALIIDVGSFPHPTRGQWTADGVAVRSLERSLEGPACDLARSCLDRGYPVEQEATIVEAGLDALERLRGNTGKR